MNKKGFTLVELLAVIVVLGLVVTISVAGYNSVFGKSKEEMVEAKLQNIELAAISWAQANPNDLTSDCSSYYGFTGLSGYEPKFCILKTVTDLVDSGFMETEEHNDETGFLTVSNNVTKKSMMCDEVLIYRKNNRMYAVMYNVKSSDGSSSCER